jgi:hypothetical protein
MMVSSPWPPVDADRINMGRATKAVPIHDRVKQFSGE